MPSARVGPAANRTASSVAVAMTSAAGTQRFTTPHDASVSDVTGSLSMAISLRRWNGMTRGRKYGSPACGTMPRR